MRIEHVDISDPEAVRELYRADLAVHEHDLPDTPFWSESEALTLLDPDSRSERKVAMLARDDDGVVLGSATLFLPLLDNLDKVYGELSVLPGHRGRGIGDALAAEVRAVAVAEGRSVLLLEGYFPIDADDTHPVRSFALRHGFALANTEVRRTLRLPLPEERLCEWAAEAGVHHQGYELHTFLDIVPAELRPSYVELLNQLGLDAPTGDIDFEAEQLSVDIYEENAERGRASGRETLIALAVRDGAAVAYSTLAVPPAGHGLPHLQQWGTYVHRAHRGHRLGMATKVHNLQAVQRAHPERTLVHTTNSPVNGPMLAINEALGFRPADVLGEFMRRL